MLDLTAKGSIPIDKATMQIRDAVTNVEATWFKECMTMGTSGGSITATDFLASCDDPWLKTAGQHVVFWDFSNYSDNSSACDFWIILLVNNLFEFKLWIQKSKWEGQIWLFAAQIRIIYFNLFCFQIDMYEEMLSSYLQWITPNILKDASFTLFPPIPENLKHQSAQIKYEFDLYLHKARARPS